jgi:putative acetyltransferase
VNDEVGTGSADDAAGEAAEEALSIVPAQDRDGPALRALIAAVFAEYPGVLFVREEMPELENVAQSFAEAGGAFFCAFRGHELVGCIGFTPSADGGIELKKLYVSKSERRHGVGQRLVDEIEEAAARRGARFIELWSDTRFATAHAFYQRRGYERGAATRELHDASDSVEYYFRRPL